MSKALSPWICHHFPGGGDFYINATGAVLDYKSCGVEG